MNKPKERPILFNTAMVQSILEGRKTHTRRVIKPQPDHFHIFDDGLVRPQAGDNDIVSRYGYSGDLLYVRETWMPAIRHNGEITGVSYYQNTPDVGRELNKWKPSIHMPKKFARIWLRVNGVRVERVKDISALDCLFEGIQLTNKEALIFLEESPNEFAGWGVDEYKDEIRYDFMKLWDSINKKRGYGWDTNPYVWVVEFERANNG